MQQFSFKNIDTFSTGSLVTRLTNDIQQVQNLIMMGLRMMLRAPGMFLGALVMAFWMNAELAAVILVVIPLLTAAIVWSYGLPTRGLRPCRKRWIRSIAASRRC